MSEMAPELFLAEDPEQPEDLATQEPGSNYGRGRNLHGRTDFITGFTSGDPAVRNEAGEIEYYDC